MAKYRKVLDEVIKKTSTKRGSRTVYHSVATYELTFIFYPKRIGYFFLSYFYPKRIVDVDGIHTRSLVL